MDNVPRMGYSGTLRGAEERQEPKAAGKPSVEFDKLIDKVEATDPEEQGKRRSGEEVEEDSEVLANEEGFAFSEEAPTATGSEVPVTIPDSQYWHDSDDVDIEPTSSVSLSSPTEAVAAGVSTDLEDVPVGRKPAAKAKPVQAARKLSKSEAEALAASMQKEVLEKPKTATSTPKAQPATAAKKAAPKAAKKPEAKPETIPTAASTKQSEAKPKRAVRATKKAGAEKSAVEKQPEATPKKKVQAKTAAQPQTEVATKKRDTKAKAKAVDEAPTPAQPQVETKPGKESKAAPTPAKQAQPQPELPTQTAVSPAVALEPQAKEEVAPKAPAIKSATHHLIPGMATLAHKTLERLAKHPVIMGDTVPPLEVRPLPMPSAVEPPQPTATHQPEAIAPSVAVERIMNYVQAAVITLQNIPGRRELTITLRGDPKLKDTPLEGLKVTVTEFSSAPRQYNITLQASPQAQALLQQHSENLLNSLQRLGQEREWSVQRLEVETRRQLFHRKGAASGGDFGGQKR